MEFSNPKICLLLWQYRRDERKWFSIIWSRLSIPKHKFITWLACCNRLLTRDRLLKFGCITNATCLFCETEKEIQQHLFFHCTYSKRIFVAVCNWIGVEVCIGDLEHCLKWVKRCRRLKLRRDLYIVVFNALIYHIWRARNNVMQKIRKEVFSFS